MSVRYHEFYRSNLIMDLTSHGLFFSESLQSFKVTASLFPSSRYLASALLRQIDFGRCTQIVELGTGTGCITAEILGRMRPDAVLYAIDVNPAFVAHVSKKLPDPRLVPLVGQAEDLNRIVDRLGVPKVDAIVSSLGLSMMADDQRRAIVGQAAKCLHGSGLMSQYQYLHAGGDPNWLRNVGLPQFSAERFLKQYFPRVSSERVLRNLPPARVFICRHQ